MCKPSKLETRSYVAAFAVIGLVTLNLISYYGGHIDEAVREGIEQDQVSSQIIAARDYWHHKYDSLSHEADFLTVAEADRKFREGAR